VTHPRRPEVSLYRRNAGEVTSRRVLHPMEKEAEIAAAPGLRRKKIRAELEERWSREEGEAAAETDRALGLLLDATDSLRDRLSALATLPVPEFRGKVDAEVARVDRARAQLQSAREALAARDFGSAGASSSEAGRELWLMGGPLVVALNNALARASTGREERAALHDNLTARQAAKRTLDSLRRSGAPPEELIEAAARIHALEAEGYELAGAILRAHERRKTTPAVTWNDVVVPDEARERLLDIVKVFVRPDVARDLGVGIPAGVLLFGPPGTGKTTIAKAMASEAGAAFYEASGADLVAEQAQRSAQKVAELFERARGDRPAIVFVDEVDALLRAGGADVPAAHQRVVKRVLQELDDGGRDGGVLLVAATNRIDIIDPAILRDHRLTAIEIGLPDVAARLQLLHVLCRQVKLGADVDMRTLALRTQGMSGADLTRLRDDAGMRALARGPADTSDLVEVTMADWIVALDELRARSTLVQA
jgi:AAA+ superfamily predicted ATPase